MATLLFSHLLGWPHRRLKNFAVPQPVANKRLNETLLGHEQCMTALPCQVHIGGDRLRLVRQLVPNVFEDVIRAPHTVCRAAHSQCRHALEDSSGHHTLFVGQPTPNAGML